MKIAFIKGCMTPLYYDTDGWQTQSGISCENLNQFRASRVMVSKKLGGILNFQHGHKYYIGTSPILPWINS